MANVGAVYASPGWSMARLTGLTLPYILQVANEGFEAAVRKNAALFRAVNTYRGTIVHPGVADSLGRLWTPLGELLGS